MPPNLAEKVNEDKFPQLEKDVTLAGKRYGSAWKIILAVLAFLVITYFIFPHWVYKEYLARYGSYFPNSVSVISDKTIYSDAIVAVTPWLMLSPWHIQDSSLHYCEGLSCLSRVIEVPIFILIYFGLLSFLLIQIFKPEQDKGSKRIYIGILGIIWFIHSIYGLNLVHEHFVKVSHKYNDALEKLQSVSGASPFPPRTSIFESVGFDHYHITDINVRPHPYLEMVDYVGADGKDFFRGTIYFGYISEQDLLKKCSANGEIIKQNIGTGLVPQPSDKYIFEDGDTLYSVDDNSGRRDFISEEAPGIFVCDDKNSYTLGSTYVGYLGENKDIYFWGYGPEQPPRSGNELTNSNRVIPEFLRYYIK